VEEDWTERIPDNQLLCGSKECPRLSEAKTMTNPTSELIEHLFEACEAKDHQAALKLFADDAVFFDPHYPNPRMEGKEAIAGALDWLFANMNKLGFTIKNHFEAADGEKAAVEVDSDHIMGNGQAVSFPQVFVVETRDAKIVRLQAYEPYGPSTG
jgi:ketosteroid isomerase-like protein